MHFIFTRRKYNQAKDRFEKKDGGSTTYAVLPHEGRNQHKVVPANQWVAELSSAAGSHGVLVFVHGFNMSMKDTYARLRDVKRGAKAAGFNGAVAAFAWPNRETGLPLSYLADRNDVPSFAPALLADGIKPIMATGKKVHVLCHSMGAYVLMMALSDQIPPRKIDQIAFAASDVDQPLFGTNKDGSKLMQLWATRFTNYYSTKDRILDLSEAFIQGDPRVGGDGLPHPTPAKQIDVDCTGRYMAPEHDGKRRSRYSHTFYFKDSVWRADLGAVLQGKSPNRRAAPTPPDHAL